MSKSSLAITGSLVVFLAVSTIGSGRARPGILGWKAAHPPVVAAGVEPFVQVPNPLASDNPVHKLVAMALPAIGQPFKDASFGTTLTRVTQVEAPGGNPISRHEYSRHDPFNKDQSLIVLLPEGAWRVFRTQSMPYNQDSNLLITLRNVAEPRWDRLDPNLIWCLRQFQILTVNVLTGQETTVKDFSQDPLIGPILKAEPDLYRITSKDEGEPSLDKRFWAFILQGFNEDYRARYIFCWDRILDKVVGLYKLPGEQSYIDWVGMSPKGKWVLIGGASYNGGKLAGLVMANRELTQFHRLDFTTAHADVGLDVEGNEVVVMQNVRTDYVDLIPIDLNTKPILEPGGSYTGTNRTPLMILYYSQPSPQGLNSGIHISCNVPGYCVVSTNTEPGLPEQNWLDRTVTLIRLDRSAVKVFYLAKVYNTTGDYWEETHGSITNDGSKVVWADNWGQNVGQGQVFLTQLDMPAGWIQMPSITVYSPNGGESLKGGSTHGITWTSAGTVGPVRIEFSTNNGSTWSVIANSAANSGSYAWQVPSVFSQKCLIRISDASNSGIADLSDDTFAVSAAPRKADLIGSWEGQGVYIRDSDTSLWSYLTSPASLLAAGDLDGDGTDDVIGVWPSGTWHRPSTTGVWVKLASPARDLAVGDLDGDGRTDLLGIWDSTIYCRNSVNGNWAALASGAQRAAAADLDGDGTDDLLGVWPSGLWVKLSSSGQWAWLASPADSIAVGDRTGDGRPDVIGTWSGQGTFLRDTATGAWTLVASPARCLAAGDLDGDAKTDVLGVWPSGTWVQYSASGNWVWLASPADSLAAGRLRSPVTSKQ